MEQELERTWKPWAITAKIFCFILYINLHPITTLPLETRADARPPAYPNILTPGNSSPERYSMSAFPAKET